MSIKEVYYEKADEAISFIAGFAEHNSKDFLFRGHGKQEYRLCTTLNRFTTIPHENWRTDIDEILEKFRVGITKLGLNPISSNSRLDWMEYARHYGVPTPCVDFSYSPYVALFFAFNGIRKQFPTPEKPIYSVVYILDVTQLGEIWANFAKFPQSDNNDFSTLYRNFRFPGKELFIDGFPANILQLIPYPGRYNSRMQQQFGALLYDTLNYRMLNETHKISDLESFIEKRYELPVSFPTGETKDGEPALIKVYINQQCVSEIFTKIELMGAMGGPLYMDPNGVALDVINSYNYNSKTLYVRGIAFGPIDELKL